MAEIDRLEKITQLLEPSQHTKQLASWRSTMQASDITHKDVMRHQLQKRIDCLAQASGWRCDGTANFPFFACSTSPDGTGMSALPA